MHFVHVRKNKKPCGCRVLCVFEKNGLDKIMEGVFLWRLLHGRLAGCAGLFCCGLCLIIVWIKVLHKYVEGFACSLHEFSARFVFFVLGYFMSMPGINNFSY